MVDVKLNMMNRIQGYTREDLSVDIPFVAFEVHIVHDTVKYKAWPSKIPDIWVWYISVQPEYGNDKRTVAIRHSSLVSTIE